MKIAVFGTRGIPNQYGGFEQFAEHLSVGLVKLGHEVTVYSSHNHPFKENEFNGVKIIHAYDPEHRIGTAGQFIYDLNCIRDLRKQDFDIILQLGYTSSSVWSRLLPRKKSKVITNMDGLEWKRTKYRASIRRFLKYAESLAVKHSDLLIADSVGIQSYLKEKYNVDSTYIPYGANIPQIHNTGILNELDLKAGKYSMLIARLEPENNIELILDAVYETENDDPFLVIGKYDNKFGNYLRRKYSDISKIHFLGGIYDQDKLNDLRYHCRFYFHGHSVGGTNPSLLEAMASSALICAHENPFNRAILDDSGFYFSTSLEISDLLSKGEKELYAEFIHKNLEKISSIYRWDRIIGLYNDAFLTVKA